AADAKAAGAGRRAAGRNRRAEAGACRRTAGANRRKRRAGQRRRKLETGLYICRRLGYHLPYPGAGGTDRTAPTIEPSGVTGDSWKQPQGSTGRGSWPVAWAERAACAPSARRVLFFPFFRTNAL